MKIKHLNVKAAEETDNELELDHPDQEFDSADTSINSNKLPAVYRMIKIPEGTTGVDFGGGRFDNAVEHIRDLGATLCVYDPYNRSAEHNKEVIRTLRVNGGADWAINSNVLNVIKEGTARRAVLENISKITKSGAPIYITVYEGRGDGKGGPTKAGYQLNRKTADYLEEIQEVFPDAVRKGKLIIAHNNRSVDSSKRVNAATNSNITNKLQSELNKKLHEVMTQRSFGFLPDEVDEYSLVKVTEEEGRIKAEVRAELDYDGLFELCEALNSVVEKYDTDAYFEPVEPGIADAYIEINQNINSAANSNQKYWYFTTHGVQPGSVPKGINILDIVDEPSGSYFATDSVIHTKDLIEYDIKERKPENVASSSFVNKYGEHHDYVSRGGRKFSVYYNEIDNSPKADAHKMWEDFKAQVSMISPYDDADYVWANIKNGNIFIMQGNKAIDNSYYMDADDMDIENGEWCDAIIEQAIDNISEINDNIEPRIIHDSTEVTKSTVEASSYYEPDDAYEFSHSFLPEGDEVTADDTFDCEGEEYVWVGPRSDTIHIDFDNWCVWEAVKVEDATKQYENGTDADSWYFVVDTDTGFIDWGPCDTLKEARDFLNSKVDDWNEEVNSADKPSKNSKPVNASWYDVPERDLNPPEYDEPEEVEDIGEVEFDLNCNIIMSSDGIWEYENNDYSFASPDEGDSWWYSNEYEIPFENQASTIVEDLDELLTPLIPAEDGIYHLQGNVHMIYKLEDIYIYTDNYDEDDYDQTIDTDYMTKYFDANKSKINNFKWTKIR